MDLGKDTECLGTPLRCLLISGIILVALFATFVFPIVGIPLDIGAVLAAGYLGRDLFGFTGLFNKGEKK